MCCFWGFSADFAMWRKNSIRGISKISRDIIEIRDCGVFKERVSNVAGGVKSIIFDSPQPFRKRLIKSTMNWLPSLGIQDENNPFREPFVVENRERNPCSLATPPQPFSQFTMLTCKKFDQKDAM